MGSKVRLVGLAMPWDTLSDDARPPKEPAACGLPYYRMYRPGSLDGTLQRIELGCDENVELLWTHDGETLASTVDNSLRLWNAELGLMFAAEINSADPIIQILRRRKFGVSTQTSCRVQRYEYIERKWTKLVFSAELVHVAIELTPAFTSTWVRIVDDSVTTVPLRNRNPCPRALANRVKIYA
jgi:hypothetical protein